MSGAERFRRLTDVQAVSESLKTRSVRGGMISMAAEGFNFVLRLGSVAVFSRLLIPEYFGLISMVTAITLLADRFKDLGLVNATIQKNDLTHEQVSTLFWINAGAGAVLMLGVMALAYPISVFYGDRRLIAITLAIATSLPFGGMAVQHQALLRRQLKFTEIASIQVVTSVLSIVLGVVMALKGFGYWALVGREVSRSLFMMVATWICFPWIPGPPSTRAGVGSMLRYGGDLTGFNLVFLICSNLDQVLIGKLFGAGSLGLYRQGFALVLGPVNQLSNPVHVVGESALSRLQNDPERFRRYYARLLGLLSLVSMPVVVFLALYAEKVVLVALGPRWIEATPIFQIMAVAALLRPAAATAGSVMLSCGHSRRFFWMGLITSVSLVLAFLAGIPFGTPGIASAYVWTLYLLLLPRLYWSFKETPVTVGLFFSSIGRPLAASLLMGVVLAVFRQMNLVANAFGDLCCGGLVAVLSYFAVWFLLPGGGSELKRLISDFSGGLDLGGIFKRKERARTVT